MMQEATKKLNEIQTLLQPYVNQGIVLADQYLNKAEAELYQRVPQVSSMNNFEKFLLLNVVLLLVVLVLMIIPIFNPIRIYRSCVQMFFRLPMVRKKIDEQLEKTRKDFMDSYPEQFRSTLKTIPYSQVTPTVGTKSEIESTKGYLSGSRYLDKRNCDFISNLAKEFSYSNPLHFDLHPYLKQMEVEVIKMCAKMLNFYGEKKILDHPEVVGGFYSGGTESILMAILAYREYGYKHKGIKSPNLVICETGHAAALKACDMFKIQVRLVGTDSKQRMSVSGMKKNIDSNTICVYTSYPNYPYGTVDPIEDIAYICKKKGVPVHIDMCLGGYLVPFLKDKHGKPMLTIPKGITSISMDCHKYGLSAKGASVLLFSSEQIRKEHIFITGYWPGGLYGTMGIAGSRSGASIASAWIAMMKTGVKGYTKNAQNIQKATMILAKQLKDLGFKIFGEPEICTIGFTHPKISLAILQEEMKKKQWDLPLIQKPLAIHYSFTPINALKIDQMVADFKEVMPRVIKLSKESKKISSAEGELYGACAKIPDSGAKRIIMERVLDLFLQI